MPRDSVRYRCLEHRRLLYFEDNHFRCPEGHETVLAYDISEQERVKVQENGWGVGVCSFP